jgi:hypothetical protein
MLTNLPPETTKQDLLDCFLHSHVAEECYVDLVTTGPVEMESYCCCFSRPKQIEIPNCKDLPVLVNDMVCACFDVKQLVTTYHEKDDAEVVRQQLQNMHTKKLQENASDSELQGLKDMIEESNTEYGEKQTAYQEACTEYDQRRMENKLECTGVAFVTFKSSKHRDAVYEYFVPPWMVWFQRFFTNCCCWMCGCCPQKMPPTIHGCTIGYYKNFLLCFRKIKMRRAPEPSEIYWENFGITAFERTKRIVRNTVVGSGTALDAAMI